MARSIRDLFVRVGLRVDEDTPLRRFDQGISRLKSNVRLLKIALLGTAGALTGIGFILKQAGGFEQTEIAFETLIGNAEQAEKSLMELFELARTTPFLIPELLQAGRQLLALGTPVEELREEVSMLGDVAAGTNTPIFMIADAFSKARASGFLFGEVFRQFRRQGVPITKELEKITGLAGKELRRMGADGEITFALLQQAFKNMTGEGGKFFQLMQRQSRTFLGIMSNIKDSLLIASIQIGEGLLPKVRQLASDLLKFLETNRKIINLKGRKIFEEIGKGLFFAFKIASDLGSSLLSLTEIFGGLGNTIKFATLAFTAFFGISTLTGIGNVTIGIIQLAGALKAMGTIGAIAQIKAFTFPLLVGVGVAALILLIEDLIGLFTGKESVAEKFLNFLGKDTPTFLREFNRDLKDFINTLKLFFKTAASGIPTGVGLLKKGVAKSPLNIGDINRAIDTLTLGGLSGLSSLIGKGDIFGLGQPARAGNSFVFSPTISITGQGAVPGVVDPITEIENALQNFWDEKMRETAIDVQRTERK